MAGFFGRLFGSKAGPGSGVDAKELFESMITFAATELLKGHNSTDVQGMLVREFRAHDVTREQADMALTAARQIAADVAKQSGSDLEKDSFKVDIRQRVKSTVAGKPGGFRSVEEAEAVGYIQGILMLTYPRHNVAEIVTDVVNGYGLQAETARRHLEKCIQILKEDGMIQDA